MKRTAQIGANVRNTILDLAGKRSVKLFQLMVKGRDVTLFPRLEVEQSGRSVKSMAVVSRSSITRAARASIYRRWGRFFREVDSR